MEICKELVGCTYDVEGRQVGPDGCDWHVDGIGECELVSAGDGTGGGDVGGCREEFGRRGEGGGFLAHVFDGWEEGGYGHAGCGGGERGRVTGAFMDSAFLRPY